MAFASSTARVPSSPSTSGAAVEHRAGEVAMRVDEAVEPLAARPRDVDVPPLVRELRVLVFTLVGQPLRVVVLRDAEVVAVLESHRAEVAEQLEAFVPGGIRERRDEHSGGTRFPFEHRDRLVLDGGA